MSTIKEQEWDNSPESSKEFLDPSSVLPEDEGDETELKAVAAKGKSQFTDLRRRIEERLDSKRIDLEYDWDDLDEAPENLQ